MKSNLHFILHAIFHLIFHHGANMLQKPLSRPKLEGSAAISSSASVETVLDRSPTLYRTRCCSHRTNTSLCASKKHVIATDHLDLTNLLARIVPGFEDGLGSSSVARVVRPCSRANHTKSIKVQPVQVRDARILKHAK